jgi:adenylate kinase
MFVYVGGVPGVGKTTVATETEKLARKLEIRMEKIRGAPILCELAGVSTDAELRDLPESMRRALRPEMNRRLYELDRADFETIRLADGHFVYFDIEGKDYGVREIQEWDEGQMIAIAVIVASPNTVLRRRSKDANDRRDRKHDLNFLLREQKMEIDVAASQAMELSIPFCFISNDGNENPTASEMLLSFCLHQALCHKIRTQVCK